MSNIKLNHNVNKPGVTVTTALEPTTRVYDRNTGMRVMAVFTAEKGPVNQRTVCTSLKQFRATYGDYRAGCYGFPLADVLFGSMGWMGEYGKKAELHCVRVADPNGVRASYTCADGASVNTVKVQAKNVGPWGNSIQFQFLTGSLIDTVTSPGSAPLTTTAASGGSIGTGTYEIAYCYSNSNGDTLVSQTKSVTIATGSENKIAVTSPDVLPYGVDKIKVFVKVSSVWRLAATSASGANTVDITAIPSSGTRQDVTTNGCTIGTRKLKLWYKNTLVGQWDNLRLTDSNIDEFNASNIYVDLVNLDSVTPEPNNLPAVMSEARYLQDGVDDLTNVTTVEIIGEDDPTTGKTGLQIFREEDLGTGIVLAPGWSDSTVHDALVDIAEDFYRVALLDLPSNYVPQDVYDWSTSGDVDSYHAQALYPWWWYENPFWKAQNSTRRVLMPLSIQAAGAYVWSAMNKGPYAAPAGKEMRLRACPSAISDLNLNGGLAKDAQGSELVNQNILENLNNDYRVSAAITKTNVGPVIFSEVLKVESNVITRVHEVLVLNRLFYNLKYAYEASGLLFQTLNAKDYRNLFWRAREIGKNTMKDIFNQGGMVGLKGNSLSDDFNSSCRIVCDADNNPPEELQQGYLNIDVYWYNVPVIEGLRVVMHPRNLTDGLN